MFILHAISLGTNTDFYVCNKAEYRKAYKKIPVNVSIAETKILAQRTKTNHCVCDGVF